MFTIRGENIYPSEIDAALNLMPGYGGEHRIVITREAAMDELLLRIEPTESIHAAGSAALETFRAQASHRVQTVLGVRAKVELAEPNSIQRTDFKARRVIDDREVFRALNQQLQGQYVKAMRKQ